MARIIRGPRSPIAFKKGQTTAVATRLFQAEAEKILHGWVKRRRLERQRERFERELARLKSIRPLKDAVSLERRATLRRAIAKRSEAEPPGDWMLRETYQLVRSLIRAGQTNVLKDLAATVDQRHAGKTPIADKPFKQAMLIMYWWNPEHSAKPLIDRRRRSEFSDALEYAYLHRKTPRMMTRFIRRIGLKRILAKLRQELRDQSVSRTVANKGLGTNAAPA